MLNTKQLLSALLAAGVLALSGSAGAADFLADRHGARGVECKTCHQTATPAPGAVVSSKAATAATAASTRWPNARRTWSRIRTTTT